MSKITLTGAEQLFNHQSLLENAILTTVNNLYNRITLADLYSSETEPRCCFIKIASLLSIHAEPSHPADLLITASFITQNFAETLHRLYDQMAAPKFVMTLGTCIPTENSLVPVDSLIPVDIYLSECPLRSQTILEAIASLPGGFAHLHHS